MPRRQWSSKADQVEQTTSIDDSEEASAIEQHEAKQLAELVVEDLGCVELTVVITVFEGFC